MSEPERTVWIDAPTERVWELLSRFENWPEWGPSVRSVETEFESVAPGARGRVVTPIGLSLPFEIQQVDPNHYWDWRVGGSPATGHWLRPKDSGSEVTFTVPKIAYPYVLVLSRGLNNLKRIAES